VLTIADVHLAMCLGSPDIPDTDLIFLPGLPGHNDDARPVGIVCAAPTVQAPSVAEFSLQPISHWLALVHDVNG
jgi:hypothetical protein